MISNRHLAFFLVLVLMMPAASVWASDDGEMTFEPEDVDEQDDDEEGMTFAPDDLDDSAYDPEADMAEALDVGVVAIPSDDLSDQERDELQKVLREAVRTIPDISSYGDGDLLPALLDRDPDYCSRESLCLAGVGRGAGVQRIVQARVEKAGAGYRLDLDYFDVDDRLFVAYHSASSLRSFNDVLEAVPDGVNDIFDIRTAPEDDGFVDDRDVNMPRVMSYASGGGAAAFLAAGIYFGLQVNGLQADLEGEARDDEGRYVELTQRQAREVQRDIESKALSANTLFGISGALAITSVVLFVLSSGDDDVEQASGRTVDDAPWYRTVEIGPRFDNDGLGLGARWSF